MPGNTPASFDAALAHGVDMIEFDVLPENQHEPEKGRLLLAHDYEHVENAPTLEEGPRAPRRARRSTASSSTSTSSSPATRSAWSRRCASTAWSSAR